MNFQTRLRGAPAALLAALLLVPFAASAAPPSPGPVKLVVILSIDGLSWPRLQTYDPWFQGGFRRLLDEGQVETACHYGHINTETGPGHASLSTGAPPRVHGIVANRWFEADPEGPGLINVYCTDQQLLPFYEEVAKEGRLYVFSRRRQKEIWEGSGEMGNRMSSHIGAGPNGETLVFDGDEAVVLYNQRHGLPFKAKPIKIAGPANLKMPTLADRLVAASPSSRVASLAGKDRSAILLAGSHPDHVVYWYDYSNGRFTSSAAYDAEGPAATAGRNLVQRFNQTQAGWQLVSRFGTTWSRLPEPRDAVARPRPESNLGRYQTANLGIGFDHDLLRNPSGYFSSIYSSPFQDQLLTDLALAFLADPALSLGRRGVPDVLALSFSAHDVVSHNFGNESEETLDTLRRLDLELGRLLAALDALAKAEPRGQVVLALSADHGFAPFPEVARRTNERRMGGRLLSPPDNPRDWETPYPNFMERVNRGLAEELCLPADAQALYGVEGWTVAYNPQPLRTVEGPCGPADRLVTFEDLDRAFPRVVQRFFGEEIEKVLLLSESERWPADDPATGFARNDLYAGRSGNAFLIPKDNVLMHWDPVRGSGHGSHHPYDTNVPLIFWGGPFKAGRRSGSCAPYDLAPTLAQVLGLRLDDRVTGGSRLTR